MPTAVSILCSGAIACTVVATAAPASAQAADHRPRLAQARARSELGRRHYELGEYRAAVAAYRAAYLLVPSPGVLFDLGQAYRMGGDCAAAAGAYRSFLRTEPTEATGPARQIASEQLPGVDACARAVESASARRDRRRRDAGVVVSTIGVAALGAAAYFAIDAHRAETAVEQQSQRGGRWSDIADLDARGRRSSSLAIGLAIGGGAALTTGLVLHALGRHHGSRAPAELWVTPGPTAPLVGASWGF